MLELDAEGEWSQEGPTLSNDIWKKFELIPTPPRSPLHEADLCYTKPFELSSLPEYLDFDLPSFEVGNLNVDLETIDLLPDDLQGCGPGGLPCAHGTCNSCTQLALAGSELRHDCMWRGTCTAEAHSHYQHEQKRSHRDSSSHIAELLESSAALEGAAGFTHLADLHGHEDEEDEDEDAAIDDMDVEESNSLTARPDTPSESSETDTDEEDQLDDEVMEEVGDDYDDEYTCQLPPLVHVDHSYHCPRLPSPGPGSGTAPAMPSTPSESEDEIDVVSVGSTDSAYSSSSSRSSTRGAEKRKRESDLASAVPATDSTTTTFVTTISGSKKIVKVHTSSLPSKPSRHDRKQLQQAVAVGVKRRSTASSHSSGGAGLLHKTPSSPHKSNKRIQRNHMQRKRRAPRSESDDPEKRNLHNSLERMRRVDLRNAFEDLRALVPDLSEREKAPKVEILRKASEHCYSLTQRDRLLEQEKERQKRYHNDLKRRLQALQRQLR